MAPCLDRMHGQWPSDYGKEGKQHIIAKGSPLPLPPQHVVSTAVHVVNALASVNPWGNIFFRNYYCRVGLLSPPFLSFHAPGNYASRSSFSCPSVGKLEGPHGLLRTGPQITQLHSQVSGHLRSTLVYLVSVDYYLCIHDTNLSRVKWPKYRCRLDAMLCKQCTRTGRKTES